jgi:hypothetical protein
LKPNYFHPHFLDTSLKPSFLLFFEFFCNSNNFNNKKKCSTIHKIHPFSTFGNPMIFTLIFWTPVWSLHFYSLFNFFTIHVETISTIINEQMFNKPKATSLLQSWNGGQFYNSFLFLDKQSAI